MDPQKVQGALTIERNNENIGQLHVDGVVGFDFYGDAWDAGYFKRQLEGLGAVDRLEVYINSPGGSVTDGVAIMNALVRHPAPVDVYVDGMAASIASVIAMAAEPGRLFMPDNTFLFIHEPWTYAQGNADEFRKAADELDKFRDLIVNSYQRHFNLSADELVAAMKEETMYTADACADICGAVVLETLQAVATITPEAVAKLPQAVQDAYRALPSAESADEPEADTADEAEDDDDETEESAESAPEEEAGDGQADTEPEAPETGDAGASQSEGTPDSEEDDPDEDAPEEPEARAPQFSAVALDQLTPEARQRIETEVKAELLVNLQARFDEQAGKLAKVEALAGRYQSERDKTRAELETVTAQNKSLSAKLDKLTRGGLSFHQEIGSWAEALAQHDGDYVKARKAHPELYAQFMQSKKPRRG